MKHYRMPKGARTLNFVTHGAARGGMQNLPSEIRKSTKFKNTRVCEIGVFTSLWGAFGFIELQQIRGR